MSTNIYVENLPGRTTAEEIRDLCTAYGAVRHTQEATATIAGLHGVTLQGRPLTVNVGWPRPDRCNGNGNGQNRCW